MDTMNNSITALPLANEQKIKEGKAEIIVSDKKVFYNPVQEFNRDLRYQYSIVIIFQLF